MFSTDSLLNNIGRLITLNPRASFFFFWIFSDDQSSEKWNPEIIKNIDNDKMGRNCQIKKINIATKMYIRLKAKNSNKLLYILNFLAIKVSSAPWGNPKKTTKLNKITDKILASVIPISKILENRKNKVEEVKKSKVSVLIFLLFNFKFLLNTLKKFFLALHI